MYTKVLLCCILPHDSIQLNITAVDLKIVFEKYGEVKKVQIFERTPLMKAFIEFSELKGTTNALSHFSDDKTNFAFLRIYQSKKKFIIPNIQEKIQEKRMKKQQKMDEQYSNQNQEPFHSNKNLNHPSCFSPISSASVCSWNKTNSSQVPFYFIDTKCNKDNEVCRLEEKKESYSPNNLEQKPVVLKWTLSYQNLANVKTTILKITRRSFKGIKTIRLLNLFGFYGGIKKILINLETNQAFVEYADQQDMFIAGYQLKNVRFLGEDLQLSNSGLSSFDGNFFPKNHKNKIRNVRENAAKARVNQTQYAITLSPTQHLKIENLPNSMSYFLIHSLLTLYQKPVVFRFIQNSQERATKTILVRFKTVHQAVEILAKLQCQKINASKLWIAFSNQEILEEQLKIHL